jgi:hypothetical protein
MAREKMTHTLVEEGWCPWLSQSRWFCQSLGLTTAASGGKNFGLWLVGAADQPQPKTHSVKIFCEKRDWCRELGKI